ncbi:hypothetical protein [Aliarcobacter cryaerophilus]|jgi:coproporphyrinogen III oxidase|uniref:hypothetical protein n=1 Tax=Aliarcobacter cryaerophilus TaxID=28198 RepID=UPI0016546B6C|nr:hypothetical protein [Aliarcobacter cryaerophilus]MBP6715104.1 hypothetical protein [Aliarcobacter sp.]QNM92329.1 hypothetical protein HOO33_00335 [Aliarcobacter cryaerophilus]
MNIISEKDFEDRLSFEQKVTDAKISALLNILEKTDSKIWEKFADELDKELLKREISPGEDCLGYRFQD